MALGTEHTSVQKPLLRCAEEAGWDYVPREEALFLRRGATGLTCHDTLIRQFQRLNPGVVDLLRAEEFVWRLLRVAPTI